MPDSRHILIDDVDKRPAIPSRPPHAMISGADFAHPARRRLDLPWQAWLIGGLITAGLLAFIVYRLDQAIRAWSESSPVAAFLVVFTPPASVAVLLFVGLYWLSGTAYYSIARRRAAAYQELLTRTRLGTPIAADTAARMDAEMVYVAEQQAITLELERAPHTKFPLLASLSEGSSERADTTIYGAGEEPTAPTLSPGDGPMLAQLRKRYGRSAEHLFVGAIGDTPIYLRWKVAGLSAIAGGSGSGKTNTTRLIAAWHALNGGGLALCDGHGEVADESLIQSCGALAPAFVLPPAVKDIDIAAVIRRMDAIGRARLAGLEPPNIPLLLVIDEFTSLCRNHSHAADLVNCLLNFGDEYRKVNMQALVIGHHWRGDLIDKQLGAALRAAIGTRIIHATAPEEAKFLLRPAETQGIDRLRAGEALFFDRSADVQKIVVPWLPSEALNEVAYPAHPGWPLSVETPQEQQRSDRQRHLDHLRRQAESMDRPTRLAGARQLASLGYGQREIQHACIISDADAGAIWRAAKSGNGVTA